MLASVADHPPMVRVLLKHKASTQAKDKVSPISYSAGEVTPLDFICFTERLHSSIFSLQSWKL